MFQASLAGAATKVEETYGVAMLLAASGGFLDAFTYLGHGHVFTNAMTGNVVLLSVFAAAGNRAQSLAHLYPILAFLFGVAGAFQKDFAGTLLVLGISFVAALQSSRFRRAGKWAYNSTMTTGSLRLSGEAFFQTLFGARDSDSAEKGKLYAVLCVSFLPGAVAGGLCTLALNNRVLWIVDAALRMRPRNTD